MPILNFMKEVFKNIVMYRRITNATTKNETNTFLELVAQVLSY